MSKKKDEKDPWSYLVGYKTKDIQLRGKLNVLFAHMLKQAITTVEMQEALGVVKEHEAQTISDAKFIDSL